MKNEEFVFLHIEIYKKEEGGRWREEGMRVLWDVYQFMRL
jgi:hypothetical protein